MYSIYTLTTYIPFPLIYERHLYLCWVPDPESRLEKDSSYPVPIHRLVIHSLYFWCSLKSQALSLAVQIVFILSPSLSYIPPLQQGKFLWTVAIYPGFSWEKSMAFHVIGWYFHPMCFFGHFSDLRLDLDGAGTVDFEELLGCNESKLTLPS